MDYKHKNSTIMKTNKYIALVVLIGSLVLSSCVQTDIDDALEYDKHYKTTEDADNAILGVYSSFMRMADQMLILNELRGELTDLTAYSGTELQEIDAANPSASNTLADPTPYYNVILNCNDALENFKIMLQNNRMTQEEFRERYADLTAMRCYMYLQLAAQFGRVYYITKPIVNLADMRAYSDSAKVTIDQLLPLLIADMESLEFMDPYVTSPLVQYNLDGYDLSYFFINKKLMLADLYLWNGDYLKAAFLYKEIMDTYSDGEATVNCYTYKLAAATTWMLGGTDKEITAAVNNLAGNLSGMVCDGGKPGCALKVSTCASEAVLAAFLSLEGVEIEQSDGIIGWSIQETLENIAKVCYHGMLEANSCIYRIIEDKMIHKGEGRISAAT